MTEELGILELILGASLTVQLVMLILLLASVVSWYMIVQRLMLLRRTDEELVAFEAHFWSGIDLSELYRQGNQAVADGAPPTGVESIFRAGFKEFSRLSQQTDIQADAVLEGARRAMRVATLTRERSTRGQLALLSVGGVHQPLHRPVWYGVGHHALVSWPGKRDASNVGHRCARHFGGANSNGDGSVCCHTCGARLQSVCRTGRLSY